MSHLLTSEVASVLCKGFVLEDSAGNRNFLKGFEAKKFSSNVKALAVILCTHIMPRIQSEALAGSVVEC